MLVVVVVVVVRVSSSWQDVGEGSSSGEERGRLSSGEMCGSSLSPHHQPEDLNNRGQCQPPSGRNLLFI